jgi:hypothetical protein
MKNSNDTVGNRTRDSASINCTTAYSRIHEDIHKNSVTPVECTVHAAIRKGRIDTLVQNGEGGSVMSLDGPLCAFSQPRFNRESYSILLYFLFWVIPRRLNFMCLVSEQPVSSIFTTCEDGTDCSETSVQNSDYEELPKGENTTLKTRRKLEIKIY